MLQMQSIGCQIQFHQNHSHQKLMGMPTCVALVNTTCIGWPKMHSFELSRKENHNVHSLNMTFVSPRSHHSFEQIRSLLFTNLLPEIFLRAKFWVIYDTFQSILLQNMYISSIANKNATN